MSLQRGARTHPLSPVDAAWWRLDEPGNVADIGVLFLLDRPLSEAEASTFIEGGLGRHARLRQRVTGGRLRWPRWREDGSFSATRHLRLHGGNGHVDLEEQVGALMSAPLARDRPPWEMHLLERQGGGALFVRLHHCIGDGFALARLLLDLTERLGVAPASPPARRESSALALRLSDVVALAHSFIHLVTLSFDPKSSLTRPLSGVRRVAWTKPLPLAHLRAIASAFEGTVNDVLAAAAAGSVRRHLLERGEIVDDGHLRALCPVNLRRARSIDEVDPRALGNRFGLVFLDLPIGEADPRSRVAALQRSMSELKGSAEAVVAFGLLGALGTLPAPLAHPLEHFFSRKASVVFTNVPGPEVPLRLAGARIDGLIFWVPHPARLALGMSAISYAGEVRLGVRADRAVVAEPRALALAFERSVDELAAAFGVPG